MTHFKGQLQLLVLFVADTSDAVILMGTETKTGDLWICVSSSDCAVLSVGSFTRTAQVRQIHLCSVKVCCL